MLKKTKQTGNKKMNIKCPECGTDFVLSDEYRNAKVNCGNCDCTFFAVDTNASVPEVQTTIQKKPKKITILNNNIGTTMLIIILRIYAVIMILGGCIFGIICAELSSITLYLFLGPVVGIIWSLTTLFMAQILVLLKQIAEKK